MQNYKEKVDNIDEVQFMKMAEKDDKERKKKTIKWH